MAAGPNERRARAEATNRDARAQDEARIAAVRSKTARLKQERLAREAGQQEVQKAKSGKTSS
jgi:hypothetical protein